MKKVIAVTLVTLTLAGCSTASSRIRDCEDQGISRDACYVAEKNHQATMSAAAEKQALENAQSLYGSEPSHKRHKHH
ncbi:hypothetical protein NAD41_000895 [Salmonella enterica]|nr:hypothetical protein [Salmonella enterica]EKK6596279.1 hypothetical protein [Salmonella enterica]